MKVLFSPEAAEELALAAAWYEARVPGLGERFATEAEQLASQIARNPRAFPRAAGLAGQRGARKARIPSFPYSLLYLVREHGEARVLAVIHHKRRGVRGVRRRLRSG